MTRLSWGSVGERFFEAGVDRGVLYPSSGVGIVWNGLISVNESPDGGDSNPYYIDGVKYLNRSSPEEFTATISAFSYPDAFEECDGTAVIHSGLSASQQSRMTFDLCYRTKIGNDVSGDAHGYKIHLVYNALASPTERGNETFSDSPNPITFNWNITTTPEPIPHRRPSSHFTVKSTGTNPLTLAALEDILYGTEDAPPRIIRPDEIIALFDDSPEDTFTLTFGEFF